MTTLSKEVDIVVIGGGVAGFAAASAAAAEKRKVLLLDKSQSLGGDSVNTNVGTICGAYCRSFSGRMKRVGYPFTESFLDTLYKMDDHAKPYLYTEGLYIIPYEWTALKKVYESFLEEAGVEVMLGTTVEKVHCDGNRIVSLQARQQEKLINVTVNAVIDCSGNAIVSQLANIETIKEESYQAASQIFRIKNVEVIDEFALNMALKRAVVRNSEEKKWPKSYTALSVVPGSIRNSHVDLKLTLPAEITDHQETANTLMLHARQQVVNVFTVLQDEIKSFHQASLERIFPQPGIRMQQRSKGRYILTEADIMSCKKTTDSIANGTWPMEEWNTEGMLTMTYFPPDNSYSIPADCLMSEKISNLYFGGKNISATSRAMASARVMGTALQTGYAAGMLACSNSGEEHQQIMERLQHDLK